jgi:mitochondrial fission protein ELM1
MSKVWALIDDRTGHTGQVLGVIAKLGLPYQLKRLEFNALGRSLPNGLLGASLRGVNKKRSAPLKGPWPKLVIAAGRRTAPVLRYIKKQSPETVVVYLMWPGHARGIDLIVAPQHDKPPAKANVLRTLAPLHAVTPETLASAAGAWQPHFKHLKRPYVMLSLGGDTKHGSFSMENWRTVIEAAQALAQDGSLLITTSRRTPEAALTMARQLVTVPHYFYHWAEGKDNPYLGMLGLADAIVVTGDSLSMCTEACVAGKPVYIYAPPAIIPAKHKALHEALYTRGMARPLEGNASTDWAPPAALDEASDVAAEIRARFPDLSL